MMTVGFKDIPFLSVKGGASPCWGNCKHHTQSLDFLWLFEVITFIGVTRFILKESGSKGELLKYNKIHTLEKVTLAR